MKRPLSFLSGGMVFALTISSLSSTLLLSSPALSKPQPGEWVKYLNPIPKKDYSLNEAQDRQIKKKGFKSLVIQGAQPVSNREIGLFAEIDKQSQEELNTLLDKPEVNGLSVILTWRELNPEEEKYDFSRLDSLLSLVQAHNKTLIVRVSTCGADKNAESDTPDWVLKSEVKSVPFKDAQGKDHKMPVFWDSTYLAKWGNFVQDFGKRYDKNPALHSVGITGGGVMGGTMVVPELSNPLNKEKYKELEKLLTKEHGMSQRQLVEHWKYVADIFPKAFPTARLNFDIDPPTPNRAGQDSLDEISDYLIYRYGQRVYLTRQNLTDAKHGFDQYRVLLKFKADTLTGYQLDQTITEEELAKLVKYAPEDGVSFIEVPAAMFDGKNEKIAKDLNDLRSKLGYQLVSQKVSLPAEIKAGENFKAAFTFANIGSAGAMRPVRELDKDVAKSYRLQFELRDESGKPVALILHTPSVPTNTWAAGKAISWEGDLKVAKQLKPGEYSVFMSMVEPDSKRKLQILNGLSQEAPKPESTLNVGKIKVQ